MPLPEPILDGDTFFTGVNMRLDPGQLQPGLCAFARNKRFVTGKVATRPGIKKMPWTNKAYAAWEEKAYASGDIVTYSGRGAIIKASTGDGLTGKEKIEAGNGEISFGGINLLSIDEGGFGSGSASTWLTTAETDSETNSGVGGLGGSSGWSFSTSPEAAVHAAVSGTDNLYQDIGSFLGCDYVLTVTITQTSGNAGHVKFLLGTTGYGTSDINSVGYTQNGVVGQYKPNAEVGGTVTYTVNLTAKGVRPDRFYIQATSDFVGTVDSISMTETSTPERVMLTNPIEIGGSVFKTSGPVSNNSIESGTTEQVGPFFQRAASPDPGTEPPIATYTANTNISTLTGGWTSLGQRTYGYGTVYGSGIFRDPNSIEHLLVATSDGVYATKEGNPSRKLLGITSISSDVTFVQCFNVVILLRGEKLEPLVMERIDEGFKSITPVTSDTDIDENDSDGTEQIPNASTGLFFANRLLVPHQKDLVAASDFLNYTRYQPVMANFRINQGSEDELVKLVRINNTTIACFKTNSIYIVSNIYGNMSDLVLDEVTREYGAVGQNSIVQIGSDVAFLSSKRGVTSLSIADNGKVTAVDVPLSEAIQPLIDRINWNAASGSAAAYHNNRLYMAVPLDGSTDNNVILIYDFLMKAWSGYDDGEAIKVKQFVETMHQGKRRLFFLSTDGFINLYDDTLTDCGFVDEIADPDNLGRLKINQISDEVVTRGYTAGDIMVKKWKSAELLLATNDPNFVVTTQFEGPEESYLTVTPTDGKTFSRVKYSRPFDRSDFTQSMVNNDFFTKFREDYSVGLSGETNGVDITLPTGACSNTAYTSQSTCEVYASGRTWTYSSSDSGFDPDLHQHSSNKYKYRGESRYVQLKVTNTNGRVEVIGAKVGAVPGENLTNIKT